MTSYKSESSGNDSDNETGIKQLLKAFRELAKEVGGIKRDLDEVKTRTTPVKGTPTYGEDRNNAFNIMETNSKPIRTKRRESSIFNFTNEEDTAPTDNKSTIVVTTSVEPIPEEIKLHHLTPRALIKVIENMSTYTTGHQGVKRRLAEFTSMDMAKLISRKLCNSGMVEFEDYNEQLFMKSKDELYMKMFSIAIRPVSKDEYAELFCSNVPTLRAVERKSDRLQGEWTFGPKDYDVRLSEAVTRYIKVVKDTYELVNLDAPANVVKVWMKPNWGSKNEEGLLKVLHLKLGDFKDNFLTLMGGEGAMKKFGIGNQDGVEEYLETLKKVNKQMVQKGISYRQWEAEHTTPTPVADIISKVERKNKEWYNNKLKEARVYNIVDENMDDLEVIKEVDMDSDDEQLTAIEPFKQKKLFDPKKPVTILQRSTDGNKGPCFKAFSSKCEDKQCVYEHGVPALKKYGKDTLARLYNSNYMGPEGISAALMELKLSQQRPAVRGTEERAKDGRLHNIMEAQPLEESPLDM